MTEDTSSLAIGLAKVVHDHLSALSDAVHEELQHIRQSQADLARAVYYLITKDAAMSALSDNFASLAQDVSSTVAEIASKAETLIGFKAEHDAALSAAVSHFTDLHEALKDIGSKLDAPIAAHNAAAVPEGGSVEPVDAQDGGSSDQPVTATVLAPVGAGNTALSVDQASATAASELLGKAIQSGSPVAVSGPAIADGTTLEGIDNSTLHLSQPTTADHTGDGAETVTVTLAAS